MEILDWEPTNVWRVEYADGEVEIILADPASGGRRSHD